jgi:PAS domain S-box-containing protein
VQHSPTDLTGHMVGREDLLATILEKAAQPIWVVDPKGLIRFANAAAIAAFGYDSADELIGRPGHETVQYRHPDGTPYPAEDSPMLLSRTKGETVTREVEWFVRRNGSTFPVSYVSVPIEMPEGRGAVVTFTEAHPRVGEAQWRQHRESILAAQRRVAAVVAGGAGPADAFAAIAREVGNVIGLPLLAVWRYEPDGTATVVGAWGEHPQPFQAGTRWPLDGPTIAVQVLETGRPARIDDLLGVPGTTAEAARESGISSVAGAPIVVDGDVWGVMVTASVDGEPLPDHIEHRLAECTELVATAISNAASREELARLADEQAALRRVATLVARESPPAQVFAAVAEEVSRLLGIGQTGVLRYEDDNTVVVVANSDPLDPPLPVGARRTLEGDNVASRVQRTGRPVRVDDYAQLAGALAGDAQKQGFRSGAGAPIVVHGRLWGVVVAGSEKPRLPASTEERIGQFTELVATAISNVQARSDLAASRARIVAATDEERRRVVRDLHDGAQQRLVTTILTLRMAHVALQNEDEEDATALLAEALDDAEAANLELRELAHGILPAALTQGGLRAGVESLASRMPVPVENAVAVSRLPAAVEATAYFLVAEALTNVAKHAHASRATVTARAEDGALRVEVRDDGIGGARPDGRGLVGLADRLAVLDGQLRVESPANGGTLLAADIPVPD